MEKQVREIASYLAYNYTLCLTMRDNTLETTSICPSPNPDKADNYQNIQCDSWRRQNDNKFSLYRWCFLAQMLLKRY